MAAVFISLESLQHRCWLLKHHHRRRKTSPLSSWFITAQISSELRLSQLRTSPPPLR
ncbi:hypothetical protein Hanom_Chr16g01485651 [Helianthus anomalus]